MRSIKWLSEYKTKNQYFSQEDDINVFITGAETTS